MWEAFLVGYKKRLCHGGEIRVYGRNKGTRVFSCGQRDLCHLSEAQPQAGNRTKYAVKYGIKGRNNTSKKWGKEGGTMHDKSRHM